MVSARLPVFPTRTNYKNVESQLVSARNGHNLLEKKSKALQNAYNNLQNTENKSLLNEKFRASMRLLSQAEFFGADTMAFAKRCEQDSISIITSVEHVCGVTLPKFQLVIPEKEISPVGKGSSKLLKARKSMQDLLGKMVQVAAQASRARAIEADLLITNRRINALEHVIIPRLENTLVFISNELEEQEREKFFMMKKLKSSKLNEGI